MTEDDLVNLNPRKAISHLHHVARMAYNVGHILKQTSIDRQQAHFLLSATKKPVDANLVCHSMANPASVIMLTQCVNASLITKQPSSQATVVLWNWHHHYHVYTRHCHTIRRRETTAPAHFSCNQTSVQPLHNAYVADLHHVRV